MKREFTKLMAALALLVFMTPSMVAWGQTSLATWTFTSEDYPQNKTDFYANGGPCTNSTFYLNGTGSTWNTSKGYAFTAVTDIDITLKLDDRTISAGETVTFSAETFYNKASNAPMTGFNLTVKEGSSGSYSTTGLSVTSWSLSNTAATYSVTYTVQNTLSANSTIALKLTQTGKVGAGQGYMNDIAIDYTTGGGSNTYTVTYNANGATLGDVPVDENEYEEDDVVTVLGQGNLSKTGNSFANWNTAADGSGDSYEEGDTFEITGNTTLYAQWNLNTHTVTLPVTNSYGSYSMNVTNPVAYGTTVTLTYAPATGYESYDATWSVNGSTIEGNTFTMPDADVTVTVTVAESTSWTYIHQNGDGQGEASSTWVYVTDSRFTVQQTKVGNTNIAPNYADLRLYQNHYLEIFPVSSFNKVMTSVVFVCSSDSYANALANSTIVAGATSSSTNSVTATASESTVTVNLDNVVNCAYLKVTAGAQARITSITVNYANPVVVSSYDIDYADNLVNGAFATDNPDSANEGENVSVITIPAEGYRLATMTYSYGEITGNATVDGNTGTFTMPASAVTVSATFELIAANTAEFVNGVYTETLLSQTSFDNWYTYNVSGEQTWEFRSNYGAYMSGYANSSNYANEDWFISPKMTVANGKLDIAFECVGRYGEEGMITVYYSKNYAGTGDPTSSEWTWTQLTPKTTIPYANGNWNYTSISLTIEDATMEDIYFAFKYVSTDDKAGTFEVKNFTAKQYYTINLNQVENGTIASNPANMTVVGNTVTLTASPSEGYAFGEWTVLDGEANSVTVTDDQFTMPASNVEVEASFNVIQSYNVIFSSNGETIETLESVYTVEEFPTVTNLPTNYNLVGWTVNPNTNELVTLPYELTNNVEFFAVFQEPKQYSFTITTADFNTSSYAGNNGTHSSTATANDGSTMEVTWVSNQVMLSGGYMQWQKDNGYIYNSTNLGSIYEVIVEDEAGDFTTIIGNTIQPTQAVENGAYFKTSVGNSTGKTSSLTVNFLGGAYYTLVKTLNITAYQGDKDGYILVASPVSTTPAKAGMITDDNTDPENYSYDLYYFDQEQEFEWINYRQGEFNLEPGKGYLYANNSSMSLTFAGSVYNGDGKVNLSKVAGMQFEGWNLIGNPYATAATPNKSFYRMNDDGSGLKSNTETGSVNPMEGIFVVAETDGETVTFTQGTAKSVEQVVVNLTRNRGTVIDNAIVRFDEGNQLPKFQLFENSTKLYIPQGNKDYAIVRSAAEAEMPVSFRASENGTYTLAVEAENVEMNYLHLIDNLTGTDVDLLATSSYTFEASTRDYANRFKLVFKANTGMEENTATETFAYFNGTNWTVSNVGDATLQVIDMMGRVLSSETISGNANVTLNQAAGIYMLRLVNGENVKVQKVVVR